MYLRMSDAELNGCFVEFAGQLVPSLRSEIVTLQWLTSFAYRNASTFQLHLLLFDSGHWSDALRTSGSSNGPDNGGCLYGQRKMVVFGVGGGLVVPKLGRGADPCNIHQILNHGNYNRTHFGSGRCSLCLTPCSSSGSNPDLVKKCFGGLTKEVSTYFVFVVSY